MRHLKVMQYCISEFFRGVQWPSPLLCSASKALANMWNNDDLLKAAARKEAG
jgi:hypothetical protein